MPKLVFLKLGGSLITDKGRPFSPRQDRLTGLAEQISAARRADPHLHLILGHGSGSFGHQAASQYRTRLGIKDQGEWLGFAEVAFQASALNHLVMKSLHNAKVPAMVFPPSTNVRTHDGKVKVWDTRSLTTALENNILPVIYGDVVFDDKRGGTILSTEELFGFLALSLRPERILLAGIEPGVWADYPKCNQLATEITTENFNMFTPHLGHAGETDVTGGMASKVTQMLDLVRQIPELEVVIFSGVEPLAVQQVLLGGISGTVLRR